MGLSGKDHGLIVRRYWLMELNRHSQEFLGRLIPGDEVPNSKDITAFVRGLPHAENAAETSLLKARLLDVAFRWSVVAHARFQSTRRGSCAFMTFEPFAQAWRVDPLWNDDVARQWTAAFTEIANSFRDRQSARRLVSNLLERYHDHHTLNMSAEHFGAAPWTLARCFHDEFGCSPHTFLGRIRIAKAVPLLARGEKTESVALDVGYRSKKSLFDALKKLTGLPPSGIRRLSPNRIASIVERLNPWQN